MQIISKKKEEELKKIKKKGEGTHARNTRNTGKNNNSINTIKQNGVKQNK